MFPFPMLAIIAIGLPPRAYANDIDHYLRGLIDKRVSPSIAVGVVRRGKLIYARGFGEADLENNVPAGPDTVYRLGSLTKQFTATMILQLVREGKLQLGTTVAEELPDLPKTWGPITIRQLLSHTSGLKNYTAISHIFEGAALQPTTPLGILKTVWDAPLDFPPGSKWSYSNTGYEVLGMVIEKLEGRPYEASLRARILKPLGMSQTYFTSERNIVKHRAQGYSRQGEGFQHAPYLNMDWPYAAGSMESTVRDLSKWDAALYGEAVLPQATLAQMWTPVKTTDGKQQTYGLGWDTTQLSNEKIVEHGGGIHGFSTFIRRAPQLGVTVIVLCNCDDADTHKMATDLMGMADPRLRVQPPRPIVDKDPQATRSAKEILENLRAGTLDHSRLTPEFSEEVTPEREKGAHDLLAAIGPIKRFQLVEEHKSATATTRTYLAAFSKAELRVAITIEGTGKISGLSIR